MPHPSSSSGSYNWQSTTPTTDPRNGQSSTPVPASCNRHDSGQPSDATNNSSNAQSSAYFAAALAHPSRTQVVPDRNYHDHQIRQEQARFYLEACYLRDLRSPGESADQHRRRLAQDKQNATSLYSEDFASNMLPIERFGCPSVETDPSGFLERAALRSRGVIYASHESVHAREHFRRGLQAQSGIPPARTSSTETLRSRSMDRVIQRPSPRRN